jgi:hypothetical protein
MLQKAKDFFETEYREELRIKREHPEWFKPQRDVALAISRCLGVAQFLQVECGVDYKEIDPIYQEYYDKFRKLLDK